MRKTGLIILNDSGSTLYERMRQKCKSQSQQSHQAQWPNAKRETVKKTEKETDKATEKKTEAQTEDQTGKRDRNKRDII